MSDDTLKVVYEVYAIRHKPTDKFMPEYVFRGTRGGWSYWSPCAEGERMGYAGVKGSLPRLFPTRQSAYNALSAWLQGVWSKHQVGGTWEAGYIDTDTVLAPSKPIYGVERRREDMEIVEFKLIEGMPI